MNSRKVPYEDSVADVEFVLSECLRFRRDQNRLGLSAWLKSASTLDILSNLRSPIGNGSLILGSAAFARLSKLASAAIEHSDAPGSLSPDRVKKALGRIILEHFFRDEHPVDIQQVTDVFAAAVEEAKRERSDRTHYVPCRLAPTTEPDQFNIGPVIFRPKQTFQSMIEPKLVALEQHWDESCLKPSRNRTLVTNYYGAFDWIAEVRVKNCSEDISEERGRRAVKAAIDILRVVLGAEHTKQMMAGGYAQSHDRRAHLYLTEDGTPGLSFGWRSTSPVTLDNLKEILPDKNIAFLLESGGKAIEPIVDTSLDWPVSNRLVEAASWYGEAVREEFDAARIVKAMTALEHLLITDRKNMKTATVSERGAALASYPHDKSEFINWKKRLRAAYELRSDIIHGSLSPFDPMIHHRAGQCVWASGEVLKAALGAFHASNGLHQKVTKQKLSTWYDELVALAQG